jgi:hypothetical protein
MEWPGPWFAGWLAHIIAAAGTGVLGGKESSTVDSIHTCTLILWINLLYFRSFWCEVICIFVNSVDCQRM